MNIRELLQALLLWGVYPAWVIAGAVDYLCHRQTDIEHTSGTLESWMHLSQFILLLLAFAAAVLLNMNAVVFGIMVALVLTHSLVAHADVSYTDGRRHIPPVEQFVHSFMDVLPLVAVALVGVLHWPEITASPTSPIFSTQPLDTARLLLVGSFAVLSGVPILEELARTYRYRSERLQAGLATIK